MNLDTTTLTIKKINDLPVVTFNDIDEVHARPSGTSARNFKQNRQRFVEGEDFFMLKNKNLSLGEFRLTNITSVNSQGTIFLTESGYLLLVKSFTDDLAWTVQKKLIAHYFRSTQNNLPLPSQPLTREESAAYITLIDNHNTSMIKVAESINKNASVFEALAQNLLQSQTELIKTQASLIDELKVLLPQVKQSAKDPWIVSINNQLASYGANKPHILCAVYSRMKNEGINIEQLKRNYRKSTGLNYVSALKVISENEEYKRLFMTCLHTVIDESLSTTNDYSSTSKLPDKILEIIEPFNASKYQRGSLLKRIYDHMERLNHINLNDRVHAYGQNPDHRKKKVNKAFIVSQDPQLLTLFKQSAKDVYDADQIYKKVTGGIQI